MLAIENKRVDIRAWLSAPMMDAHNAYIVLVVVSSVLSLGILAPIWMKIHQNEKLWLARAVAGEVGVMGEHKQEAGTWVVHVALNRVDNDWFPGDIPSVIRQGFFGAQTYVDEDPPAWAYDVVDLALGQRKAGEDPTGGSLFLFGGQDLVDCMDMELERGRLKRDGWVFSVHLFYRWPYPAGCGYD